MCANAVLVDACLQSLLLFAWQLWRGRRGCHSGMQLVHQALPEHASLGAVVVALRMVAQPEIDMDHRDTTE